MSASEAQGRALSAEASALHGLPERRGTRGFRVTPAGARAQGTEGLGDHGLALGFARLQGAAVKGRPSLLAVYTVRWQVWKRADR